MEDFFIFIAPSGVVAASLLFLAVYIGIYNDPRDE
ncbi:MULTISPECIES: cytochrome bd oxidase small subunit CydS [Paenibacillus]|jgi:hypothetical protein